MMLTVPCRRGFLSGLIAAPAVVSASSLMPVRNIRHFLPPSYFLTHQMILRECISIFKNSNEFLITINDRYILEFRSKVSDALPIQLLVLKNAETVALNRRGLFGAFAGVAAKAA